MAPALLAAFEAGKVALSLIASFTGNAAAAKANAAIQDATKVVAAVLPLVQSFANGQDATEDDVRASFQRVGLSFDDLDTEIARRKALGE